MANCYQCGRSGATYRRAVYTGSSSGGWVSTRSSGSSSRSYSGVRSLCESCAARNDASKQRNRAILYVIGGIVIIYFILK
jgi:hypothetical protein